MPIFPDYIFVALTSVLESCSHLVVETRKSLIHLLGETLVHRVPGFIIAGCEMKLSVMIYTRIKNNEIPNLE